MGRASTWSYVLSSPVFHRICSSLPYNSHSVGIDVVRCHLADRAGRSGTVIQKEILCLLYSATPVLLYIKNSYKHLVKSERIFLWICLYVDTS